MAMLIEDNMFTAIQKIQEIYYRLLHQVRKEDSLTSFIPGDNDINPFYHQTSHGLFLEYYGYLGSHPYKLWTPYGELYIIKGGYCDSNALKRMNQEFAKRVKMYFVKPYDDRSEEGVLYGVLSVDGIQLPRAALKEKKDYDTYDDVRESWPLALQQYKKKDKKI